MPCTAPAGAGRDAGEARTLQAIALADQPHAAASGPRRRGLFVDCETTGLDHGRDQVIELAMLPFTYAIDGRITDVLRSEARTWRQDPGRPLPPEITRITGLTDAELEGEAIDTAAAVELVAGADLVVAHNAGFDRPFLETLVPAARDAAWAGSRHEVPWDPRRLPCRQRLGVRQPSSRPAAQQAAHRAVHPLAAPAFQRQRLGREQERLGGAKTLRPRPYPFAIRHRSQ